MTEIARVPVEDWTDAEWLDVLHKFSPNSRGPLAEQWVAEHRRESQAVTQQTTVQLEDT